MELLIVYHSRTGGSRAMAGAAAEAARAEAPTVLKTAADAGPEDLLRADGYLFCAPENLAAPPATICLRPCATSTILGSTKQNAGSLG